MSVIGLLGAGCVVAGVLWAAWWVRAWLLWPRAEGIVLGLDDGVELGDKHPRIQFTTGDGRTVEFTSRFGIQIPQLWPAGKRVLVLHHPDTPSRAEVVLISNALAPVIVIAFGVLLILIGIGDRGPFG